MRDPVDNKIKETRVDINNKKKYLDAFYKACNEFYLLVEHKRPFYSRDIYESMSVIIELGRNEFFEINTTRSFNEDDVNRFGEYLKWVEVNSERMEGLIDEAVEKIRSRVESWSGTDSEKV